MFTLALIMAQIIFFSPSHLVNWVTVGTAWRAISLIVCNLIWDTFFIIYLGKIFVAKWTIWNEQLEILHTLSTSSNPDVQKRKIYIYMFVNFNPSTLKVLKAVLPRATLMNLNSTIHHCAKVLLRVMKCEVQVELCTVIRRRRTLFSCSGGLWLAFRQSWTSSSHL